MRKLAGFSALPKNDGYIVLHIFYIFYIYVFLLNHAISFGVSDIVFYSINHLSEGSRDIYTCRNYVEGL